MDKLITALSDVSGLANVAAKFTHSKPIEGCEEKGGTEGLVYNTPNFTLSVAESGASGRLSLGAQSGISSLPSLIVAPVEIGVSDTLSVPSIGSSLTERRANQIAEFLNEAVATIRDGMKGMLTSSLGNGAKEEGVLLRSKIENNNKSIREIHEQHTEIIQEREQLLRKVAENESEVVMKVSECGALLNKLEVSELELKVSNRAIKQLIHENTVLRVEVAKFRYISELVRQELKESREKETALNRDNMELKLKLTEREIEILDLKAKLEQMQEKVEFLETGQVLEAQKVAQSGDKPGKVAESGSKTYVVGLVKTTEILDKVAQLKERATHGDFNSHLTTTENAIRDLVLEHESCKDTLFLIRRNMIPESTEEIVNGTNGSD